MGQGQGCGKMMHKQGWRWGTGVLVGLRLRRLLNGPYPVLAKILCRPAYQ